MMRQPIVCVMGHVDHGKTTLLDQIRKTTVALREAGGITQHIGASEVPLDIIKELTGPILKHTGLSISLPGLLFIDTPGHEAFTNLRRRGGSVADFAIVVVDISTGFQPQTVEALEILREYKTPFVVAANKVDLVKGWISSGELSISSALAKQPPWVIQELEHKLYELIGRLSFYHFNAERYDRVRDFTKEVLVIPLSAKTGEGLAELLAYVSGLTQKFLVRRLNIDTETPGKGVILEVKEEKGLGTTIDVILYEGKIQRGDTIIFATADGIKTDRVRALLKPKPLDEIRDPKKKFSCVDVVHAASGVKLAAPSLEHALAGSPVFVVTQDTEATYRAHIEQEITSICGIHHPHGVIIKADTLGSLEAILRIFKEKVHYAGIGEVNKKDVLLARSMKTSHPFYGAVLAFNVPVSKEAEEESKREGGVKIITSKIIYALLEAYDQWVADEKERERKSLLEKLSYPAKLRLIPGCCFRMSKPAIFGIEVIAGVLKTGVSLMTADGQRIGEVKEMQKNKEKVHTATVGEQLAVSIDGCCYGRDIKENDILYVYVPKEHSRILAEKYATFLGPHDLSLLEETEMVRRKYEKI